MLSYKTVIAIQSISLLLSDCKKGLTLSELQQNIGRQHNLGIRQVLVILTKNGWLKSASGNKFCFIADPTKKTLADLILALDGGFQLDTPVDINPWSEWSEQKCPNAIAIDNLMKNRVIAKLNDVKISNLINN